MTDCLFKVLESEYGGPVRCYGHVLQPGRVVRGVEVQPAVCFWDKQYGTTRSRGAVIILQLPITEPDSNMRPGLVPDALEPLDDAARALWVHCWLLTW